MRGYDHIGVRHRASTYAAARSKFALRIDSIGHRDARLPERF